MNLSDLDITKPDLDKEIRQSVFRDMYLFVELDLDCDIHWGKNVKIDPLVSIGHAGFGFDRDIGVGNYIIPLKRKDHFYGVTIGDNVEIGSNSVIHRGRWRDTVIGEGTKIDSLVHIAHNVIIGKNCLIVAGSVLGGSCEIGDECFLGINIGVGQDDDNDGGKVSIRQGVKIAHNVTIGMGAVVLKDIPEPNTTWAGSPARKIADVQKF